MWRNGGKMSGNNGGKISENGGKTQWRKWREKVAKMAGWKVLGSTPLH